jgi:hypothetical protein
LSEVFGGAVMGKIGGYVAFLEFFDFLLETVKFGGADEGEVLRVEEEDDVFFSDILFEAKAFEHGFSFNGFGAKERGWFSYEYGHFEC